MDQAKFELWLKRILETEDEEISCTDCFDLVSRYVDVEMSGGEAEVVMKHVSDHLKQCPACREEYETLHDLAEMEASGTLPALDELIK